MEVITIQMSKRYQAQRFGLELVDTTVKSGLRLFAPTWDIVMGHKRGKLQPGDDDSKYLRYAPIDDAQYTEIYNAMMRRSWNEHREEWLTFMRQEQPLALACYCPAGVFCHRHLLRRIFQHLAPAHDIPFRYYGEFT